MTPTTFAESNRELKAPSGWDEERRGKCETLPIWTDGQLCLSSWRASWRERLSILLFGRVWLYVVSGATQPPVSLSGVKTVFESKP